MMNDWMNVDQMNVDVDHSNECWWMNDYHSSSMMNDDQRKRAFLFLFFKINNWQLHQYLNNIIFYVKKST